MSSIIASATHAAHSAAASLLSAAQITVGDPIPDAKVKEANPEQTLSLAGLAGRNLIIGVPAAFSPPCSNQLPAYIEKYAQFAAKGVKAIYVVAVNDAFVTSAWKKQLAPNGTEIHFIADDTGAFTGAAGLLFDASPLLGSPRSKRYVLVTDDGKVSTIAVEASPPEVTVTGADTILAQL